MPVGRIVPLSSIPLLTRAGTNVEFDRQLIFNLDGSAGYADRSDTEITLLQRKPSGVVSVLQPCDDRDRLGHTMQRKLPVNPNFSFTVRFYVRGFERNFWETGRIQDFGSQHAVLDLLALIRRQLRIENSHL